MTGRRLPNGVPPAVLEPGDYARAEDGAWWVRTPTPLSARVRLPDAAVEVHADQTITVHLEVYGDWHGWALRQGVWSLLAWRPRLVTERLDCQWN